MKYTITMSCGHEDTIDLGGKTSNRERKRFTIYRR
jgi:hypothetical protein